MKPSRCEFISKEYGVKAGKNFYLPFSYRMKPSVLITCVKKIYTKEGDEAVHSKILSDFVRFTEKRYSNPKIVLKYICI